MGSSFAPAEAVRLGTWLGSETSLPKDAKSGWEKGLETADEEDRETSLGFIDNVAVIAVGRNLEHVEQGACRENM